MNILFAHNTQNEQEEMIGLATSLMTIKENVTIWSITGRPIFDVILEKKPDLLFIQQQDLRPEIIDAIKTFDMKVVFRGVFIPSEIINNICLLLIPNNVPEVIRANLPKEIPSHTLLPAANITQFRGGFYEDKLKSDVLYLSQYPVQNRHYIINNLTGIVSNLPILFKIVGDYKIPCPEYLGSVSLTDSIQMIKSTKILIDYDLDFMLNAILLKTFVLSNVENPYFPHFKNELELSNMVCTYLSEDKLRKKYIKQAYKTVIDKDTYLHRLIELGEKMGFEKWSEDAEQTLKRLKE